MKPLQEISKALTIAYSDVSSLVETTQEIAERLDSLQDKLFKISQNGPLTTTIKTSDAASIRAWLKAARKAHDTLSSEPTPELDRLIDLLPSE